MLLEPLVLAAIVARWRARGRWVGLLPARYHGTLSLLGPHRGEVWHLDTEDPRPTDANPRVEWFDRRDVWKLADSFAEFMAGLRPLEDDASASASP